jgi:hypothetical protein
VVPDILYSDPSAIMYHNITVSFTSKNDALLGGGGCLCV